MRLTDNPLLAAVKDNFQRLNQYVGQKTFSSRERRALYEELAFLLDNNRQLMPALKDIYLVTTDFGEKPENSTAHCIKDCMTALNNGQKLDIALAEWVPPQEVALIGAGLLDGKLADALRRTIKVVDSTSSMLFECISTLAYPLLLLSSMFFLMYTFTVEFIPKLGRLAPRENWTGALKWVATLSETVTVNGPALLILLFILISLVIWSLGNYTGRIRKRLDLMMPWSIYRDIQGVSFLLNLAALQRANLQVLDCFNILSRHASPWLLERLDAARREVNSGAHLGMALKNTGFDFPSRECVNKLILLTGGDNGEEIIENFAHTWLTHAVRRVKSRLAWLSGICLCLVTSYLMAIVYTTQSISNLAGIGS
ncbi:type II secretion system F family protein [Enterobacteriaceae bacterium H11S18]|uniref:type II secretion system F family protein n=1 Tax=Dryocola clanedunensis TaxID=2925396 RepID=UPI0022F0FEAD|nr:type II secretion system F family protein [Dryocola clanedunensis]MCT4709275.1 type II secretion system F family protein [Dryocola clanedunensis]